MPEKAGVALALAEDALRDEELWDDNAAVIEALTRNLPDESMDRVASLLSKTHMNNHQRTHAFCVLGPRLTETGRVEITEYYNRGKSEGWLTRDLQSLLACHLPQPEHAEALCEYLDSLVWVAGSYDSLMKAEMSNAALASLRCIPEGLIERAVEATRKIQRDDRRAQVLAAILPQCLETQQRAVVNEEFQRVSSIDDDKHRATAFASLVPHLKLEKRQTLAEEALSADSNADLETQCKLTSALSPYLAPVRSQRLLKELPARVLDVKDKNVGFLVDRALALLTPCLDASDIHAVVHLIDERKDGIYRTRAELIRRMPAHERAEAINTILAMPEWRPAELPEEFMEVFHKINEFMDEAQREKALAIVDRISERLPKARSVPAPNLSPLVMREMHSRMLQDARAIDDDSRRACELSAFVQMRTASPQERCAAFEEMLESSLGLTVESIVGSTKVWRNQPRSCLLERLAECADMIAEIAGPRAVEETVDAIRDTAAWWP